MAAHPECATFDEDRSRVLPDVLSQKPDDPMAKYAWFAEGHSYIMVNNPVRAKEIFESFVSRYPGDALKPYAERVLAKL